MKSRTIKVFISSTFRDMNAERDYLNKIIFPQIRSYCKTRFLQFLPIDLRWGITEEASRNGLVLSTCMEEVDNSRPFFIGILGSRYGWQPSIKELGQLRASVQKQKSWLEQKVSEGASITEMEIEYGVLRDMDIPYASFFIRSEKTPVPEDYCEEGGSDAERHLEQLKYRIRSQKKYPVTEYTSIEQFGEVVKHQITDMIEAEYPISMSDSEDAIIQKQEQIMEQRSHVLFDMSSVWNYFQDWVGNTSEQVLLISGPAGTGTSTILAYCCSQMKENYSNKIIYFDLESVNNGAKPLDALFHFLNMEQNRFPESEWGMIAIDNASMLRDKEVDRILSWLQNLNVNIHVAFATENNSDLRVSLSYLLACPCIKVDELSQEKKRQLVNNYVQQYSKQLTEQQVEAFVNIKSANVTVLTLLLRSLVNYGSYQDLNNYISQLTKNSFSHYFLWAMQKESLSAFSAIDKSLGNKYMVVLIAISAAGTGISEADMLEALGITPAEWSVLRPNVLQFCKGNEEGWKLSNSNWYPNVSYEDWENVSRHLIKWFTAHPERWYYAAPAMRHIFYLMIIPPFWGEMKGIPVQADRPIVKDVLDELFAFAMSPDMVKQLDDMEYSIMWTRPPLTTKNMSDTPTMVYGRTVSELSNNEAIDFYYRLATIANGLSRSMDARWCYQQIEKIFAKNNAPEASVYKAKTHLIVGEAKKAIDVLNHSGLIVTPQESLLSYNQACAMQQLLNACCACGKWSDTNHILQLLCNNITTNFTPQWTDSSTNRATYNAYLELVAKIAYVKSGYYPETTDEKTAWEMLKLLSKNRSSLNIGHPTSCLSRMAHLILSYKSVNSNLSEKDKELLYSIGWRAIVSTNMCFGAKSYQLARAHLLFTYIHYKLYHNYGSLATRLHDYVERDQQGRALNHTDEYFYGALDYGRYLESIVKRDLDWTIVNMEVQQQLLNEFDYFWNIENEIQPEWYRPKLREKRDLYRVRIHLLDKMPPKSMVDKKTQQVASFHSYEQSQLDYAKNRLLTKFNVNGRESSEAENLCKMGDDYNFGRNGKQKDFAEAVKYYKQAAEQGNAKAQYILGVMHERGRGVNQDYVEAVKWYRKAAELGYANAQYNLGVMCEYGQGVKKDYAEAVKWYRKAAEQGDAQAQFNLGVMSERGRGVNQDYAEAVKWYRKAAEQGYASAQYNLGVMYDTGQGVNKDYTEAVKWYRKAAEQGHATAQYNLGIMYDNGRGVKQDYAEAEKWYRKAAEQGDPNAQNKLDILLNEDSKPHHVIKIGDKYGYADRNGKVVIPCQWTKANEFVDGVGLVWDEKKMGAIRETGTRLFRCKIKCGEAYYLGHGLIKAKDGDLYTIHDLNGTNVEGELFAEMGDKFVNGYLYAVKYRLFGKNKPGRIDTKGKFIED